MVDVMISRDGVSENIYLACLKSILVHPPHRFPHSLASKILKTILRHDGSMFHSHLVHPEQCMIC